MLRWLKERAFLIMLLGTGAIFLTCTDNWQIYEQPLAQAGVWCERMLSQLGWAGDEMLAMGEDVTGGDGLTPEGNLVSGGNGFGAEGMQGALGVTGNDLLANDFIGDQGGNAWSGSGVSDGAMGTGTEAQGTAGTPEAGENMQSGAGTGDDSAPVEEPAYRDPQEVEYAQVGDDYFADAVFIGDSRTVGMYEYGGLEEISTFYASTGLTVYKMFDAAIVQVPGQREKQTVEEALQENSFAKIYLMIGINEMGTGTVETFIAKYKEAVDHLRELQPEAVIYLQGIMKVTTERSNQGDYINNEGIEARNAEIAKLADNVHVYYLDVNPLICDDTGGIEPSYTYDGVHLKAQYITIWKDYLKSHAVSNLPW